MGLGMQEPPQQGRYCTDICLEAEEETFKAGRQAGSYVQYQVKTAEKTQEAVKAPTRKTGKKKTEEPYEDISEVSGTSKDSHFKSKATRYPFRSEYLRGVRAQSLASLHLAPVQAS